MYETGEQQRRLSGMLKCEWCGTRNKESREECRACGSPILDEVSHKIQVPSYYREWGAPIGIVSVSTAMPTVNLMSTMASYDIRR